MDDRDRPLLARLLRQLLDRGDERAKVGDDCEGRFASLTAYVERRLERELPPEWRWLSKYVAHAAVGERWQRERLIVAIPAEGTSQVAPGVWVFVGKG